jgi:hypothetical protein
MSTSAAGGTAVWTWDPRSDRKAYLAWIGFIWAAILLGFGLDFTRYVGERAGRAWRAGGCRRGGKGAEGGGEQLSVPPLWGLGLPGRTQRQSATGSGLGASVRLG